MEFEYVSDGLFQEILKRDYIELKKCQQSESYKAVLLLCGSILEALLVDYFTGTLPAGTSKKTILEANLETLLDMAEKEGIINKSERSLASVLKDYRNLIHPGREVRKKEAFDKSTVEIAVLVLDSLLKKLEIKFKEKFPTTAEDIIDNLEEDWSSRSIYGIVITKLSNKEKEKLFDALVDIENDVKSKFLNYEGKDAKPVYKNIEETKSFVNDLKPLISKEAIELRLKSLLKAINSGESLDALCLYNLLHEEVQLLSKDEQELIAIYMMALLMSIIENAEELAFEKTFSTIGKYIHTAKGLEEVKKLMRECAINFGGKNLNYEIDVIEQILNSLSDENRKDVIADLSTFLRIGTGTLPIEPSFAIEATKRGFLNYKS